MKKNWTKQGRKKAHKKRIKEIKEQIKSGQYPVEKYLPSAVDELVLGYFKNGRW